jgi:hypothetical protein
MECMILVSCSLTSRFLLAKVQLDLVLHAEFAALMTPLLQNLPKSPTESYMKGLARIQAAHEVPKKAALHTLAWIYHAKRKLKMGELLDAVAWTTKTTDYKLEPIHLMDMCRGLAFHDKSSGIVQFIHGTVETFLEQCFNPERAMDTEVVKDDSHTSIIGDLRPHFLSNIDLAKACLTYLSLDIFDNPCPDRRSREERVVKHTFSVYAAMHWADHIRGVAETDRDVRGAISKAFGPVGKRESILQLETPLPFPFTTSTGMSLYHLLLEKRLPLIFMSPFSDDTSNINDRYVLRYLPS